MSMFEFSVISQIPFCLPFHLVLKKLTQLAPYEHSSVTLSWKPENKQDLPIASWHIRSNFENFGLRKPVALRTFISSPYQVFLDQNLCCQSSNSLRCLHQTARFKTRVDFDQRRHPLMRIPYTLKLGLIILIILCFFHFEIYC